MKIIEVLLKNHEVDKLVILKNLIEDNSLNINDLCDVVGCKRTTLRRHLNELNEDIKETTDESVSVVYDTRHNIIIEAPEDYNLQLLILNIQLTYLKKSIYYNVLVHIVLHNSVTMDSLAMRLNFSKSYCYHVVQELNDIFELNDLGIHLDNDEGYIRFVGKESHIRLFIFKFMFNYHQTLAWPFEYNTREHIQNEYSTSLKEQLKERSNSTKLYVDFLFATSSLRLQSKRTLTKPPKDLLFMLDTLVEHSPLANELANCLPIDGLSEEEKYLERAYFAAIVRMFIPNLEAKQSKIDIGKEMYKNQDDSFIQYCCKFMEDFINEFKVEVNEEEHDQLFYFIGVLFQTAILFQSDFVETTNVIKLEQSRDDLREMKNIKTFYSQFIKQNPSVLFSNNLTTYLPYGSNLLYLLLKTYRSLVIPIFIEYSRIPNGTLLLRRKIQQCFSENVFRVTENIEEAEVIITDYISNPNDNSKYFHIDDIFREDSWRSMFDFLNSVILDNVFRKEIED